MFERIQFWVVLILLSLAIPIGAQESATKPQANDAPATSGAVKKPATADPNYVIGSEDVLDVSVWKEPDLSRTVPVRPDGKISLPLLGDVKAEGLTPQELETKVQKQLATLVRDPHVTVIVHDVNGPRVYVTGMVGKPGAFPLRNTMGVLQALALAGGPPDVP